MSCFESAWALRQTDTSSRGKFILLWMGENAHDGVSMVTIDHLVKNSLLPKRAVEAAIKSLLRSGHVSYVSTHLIEGEKMLRFRMNIERSAF